MNLKTTGPVIAGALLLAALLFGQTTGQATGQDWQLVAGGLSPLYTYEGFTAESREGMFLLNRRTGKVYTWMTTATDDLSKEQQEQLIQSFGVGFFMPVGVATDSGRGAAALPLPSAQALRDLIGSHHRAAPEH